jgi:hypothetical protein
MKLSHLDHNYKTLAAIIIFPAMTGLLIWLVEHRNRPAPATLIVKWAARLEFALLQDLAFVLGVARISIKIGKNRHRAVSNRCTSFYWPDQRRHRQIAACAQVYYAHHFTNMADIPRGPTTKEKLATIVSGFDEFDTEMKRGTRVSAYVSLAAYSCVTCFVRLM